MIVTPPLQYVLSAREYELLQSYISQCSAKSASSQLLQFDAPTRRHDYNAAAFRSALRVFCATTASLTSWDILSSRLLAKRSSRSSRPSQPLVASSTRLALSLSGILFLHRILFRFFARLRLNLLHEKARRMRERYPRISRALTSRISPAIGASLAGFALGICPADQLRVTITIYVGSRSLEFLYNAAEAAGYLENKPSWMGSWILFALAQGQLLHAFVFDRDCFPQAYSDFILKYTPEYIQRRPPGMSGSVVWPNSNQIVDSLAEMAKSKWPPFVSPVLRPSLTTTLPATINPVVSPITSRAHPAIQHLSCALIHPSDPSCFTAYLQQNLIAFPQLARFFTIYYGALGLLRYKQLWKSPLGFVNRLSKQVLKTTTAIAGAIGASWGSICLFATVLPRSFLPKFRFFLGGLLGGCFQIFDTGSAGTGNSLYAARVSADSLWKVGVKHRWWRGFKAGDVWVFVAALAMLNVVYERSEEAVDSGAVRWLMKLLRGEADIGLPTEKGGDEKTEQTLVAGEAKLATST